MGRVKALTLRVYCRETSMRCSSRPDRLPACGNIFRLGADPEIIESEESFVIRYREDRHLGTLRSSGAMNYIASLCFTWRGAAGDITITESGSRAYSRIPE
jgi:hypothetical protein